MAWPALVALLTKAGSAVKAGASAAGKGIAQAATSATKSNTSTGAAASVGNLGGGGGGSGQSGGGFLNQASSLASRLGPNEGSAGAMYPQDSSAQPIPDQTMPQLLGVGQNWQRYRQRGLF